MTYSAELTPIGQRADAEVAALQSDLAYARGALTQTEGLLRTALTERDGLLAQKAMLITERNELALEVATLQARIAELEGTDPPPPPVTPAYTVPGLTAAAIDATLSKARPGDTVAFPAGTYEHGTLTLPVGVNIIGSGIGKTILPCAVRFQSDSTIRAITLGGTQSSSFRFVTGAHHVTLEDVRLRGRGFSIWDATDFSRDWDGPVTKRAADFNNAVFRRVEFEYPNRPDADVFSLWWDCRPGGSRVYDVTWEDCTFGARNSAGNYGMGRVGLIVQPAPSEYGTAGPRVSVNQPNPSFDWGRVDHGAGLAASPEAKYGFRMTGCRFVGAASFVAFNLCDYTRAWAVSTYNLTEPGKVTAAMKASAPDKATSKGWLIRNSWFSDDYRPEYGRDVVVENSPDNQGGAYNVPAAVLAHDRELYG